MKNIKELLYRREQISFEIVEATQSQYRLLTRELQDIEDTIEQITGKTIEEVDNSYNLWE